MNSLPPLTNVRADEMWNIISPYMALEGKTVLDVGFGGGDILFRSIAGGAKTVYGMDRHIFKRVRQYSSLLSTRYQTIKLIVCDLNNFSVPQDLRGFECNYVFCFSLLPHLENPDPLVAWIRDISEISFFECQYATEDPYPQSFKDDDDFSSYLINRIGFFAVEKIGETHVRIRDAYRSIWRCE